MVLNSCYCWNASHRQPQSYSGLHFHRGRSFPAYFQWNDSWVETIHRTADDYLTVQNQVVAMGTSFGEVILNRSNLKKQEVTIWQVWDKKVLATLESVKEKKKKYEAIIMGFTVRGIFTTIKHLL